MWDANQYLRYADERARPFHDLVANIPPGTARLIADLGCGPGNLTQLLAERWALSQVIGVDSSTEMLAQARPLALPGKLEFVQADLASWTPPAPLDLIVSNAALQWVPGHERLISHLAGLLAEDGTLAVQMPYHFGDPSHLAIEETKSSPRWSPLLGAIGLNQKSVMPPAWYVERLLDLGFTVNAWQTTYIHVLTGENPVLEWFKGSALRPLLKALDAKDQAEFLAELGGKLKAAYPPRNGITLLPFPRIFFIATRVR